MGKRKRNLAVGKVEVPQGYFLKMAKHDYNSYMKALPREFYQNSIDAEAKTIYVDIDESKRSITVEDDGIGMSLDTLRHKLLVLGGSKKGEGATGAFGKAKELLFFSWEKYEIKTRSFICQGAGAHYTINKMPKAIDGTTCTIWLPEEEEVDAYVAHFQDVAALFETDVSIIINGEKFESRLNRGELVRTTDWAKVYVNAEATHAWYMHVRINGQWMFKKYTGGDIGRIVVELSKKSTTMLTSNRDGIKSEYSGQFDDLMKEIIVEREEMLRPKPVTVRELIKGTGKVKVNWDKIKKEVNDRIQDIAMNKGIYALGELTDFRVLMKEFTEVKALQMARLADSTNGTSLWDSVSSIALIGYKPDFIIDYVNTDEKEVRKFMKTRKATILAKCWTEVIRQVLLDIGWSGMFICGFTFDKDKKAAYLKEDSVPIFLLNPHNVCKELPEIKPFINRAMLRRDLVLSACHEIAHMHTSYHDSSFVLEMQHIIIKTWQSELIYQKIINAAFRK